MAYGTDLQYPSIAESNTKSASDGLLKSTHLRSLRWDLFEQKTAKLWSILKSFHINQVVKKITIK